MSLKIFQHNFFETIDNFFTASELEFALHDLDHIGWKYNSFASNENNLNKYDKNLNFTFIDTKEPIINTSELPGINNMIIKKLESIYCVKIKPHNAYLNSYQFGNEMEIHTDRITKLNYNRTFIIYLNSCPKWELEWGGHTVIYNKEKNKILHTSIPKRNSLVVFDGLLPHAMIPIGRTCFERRIILVYQTEIE